MHHHTNYQCCYYIPGTDYICPCLVADSDILILQYPRAYALYQGRNYVIPDDIRFLAPYVLGHRVILTHKAKTEKKTGTDVVNEIVKNVVVPSSPLQAEAGAF